jgi:hypothetical protein
VLILAMSVPALSFLLAVAALVPCFTAPATSSMGTTVLVLLGDVDFRLAFLMSSLAFDDLEEAIAADADAPIGIRVEV